MPTWMVRANKGELFEQFVAQNVVAIGWSEVGNLAAFALREDLLAEVQRQYPGAGQTWQSRSGRSAGMLFRFSQVMEPNHHVITYYPMRRLYAVGRINDGYLHDPEIVPGYPHVRPVEWMATEISRDILSLATKSALGATQTVFQLSADAEQEVLDVAQNGLRSQLADPIPPEDFLEDTQSRSIEFTKDLIVSLNWEDLQKLVAGLLRAMGYRTRISPQGPDQGKDIVASRDGLGFENPRIVVEVKHRPKTSTSAPEIRSFVGGRHPDDRGLYVSTGGFTREARYESERANIRVTTMGLDELVEAIIEHYDNMDIETRMLLPLRRIYWPINDSRREELTP